MVTTQNSVKDVTLLIDKLRNILLYSPNMAVETRTTSQETVMWHLSNQFNADTKRNLDIVQVGQHEFDRAEFYIGIVEFLAGEKQIRVGSVDVSIPDEPTGNVQFGDKELAYKEYLSGIMWALQNDGVYYQEFQVPLSIAQAVALEALHRQLEMQVPQRNERILEHAKELRVDTAKPGGIRGLRPGEAWSSR